MFGKNPYEGAVFGKKEKAPAEPSETAPAAGNEAVELADFFDDLQNESLKQSINDHAIAVISGKAQDHILRQKLEQEANTQGIDSEMLGKLINLQVKRLNGE